MTKIVVCEIFKYKYDAGGYKLSYGAIDKIHPVILKLTNSDGNIGWGEANPQRPFTTEDANDVISMLKDVLLPRILAEADTDPFRMHEFLNRDQCETNLMAKGAIDMALMDLEGKSRGVPVWALLGKPLRDKIDISRPLKNGTAEDDIPVIDQAIKEGYSHFMLKAGDKDYPARNEVSRLDKLSQRYGSKATFKVDANTGWTMEESRTFLNALPQHLGAGYLAYLEQPIDKHDVDGLSELQASTDLRISVDESLTGIQSAREIVLKKAAKVFSIKISKNGGILNARAIAQLAAENDILCYPNSMLEGGITQASLLHLAVTLPNLVEAGGSFRSVLRLGGCDVTNFHTFIQDGVVHLPEGPGLGIEVDEQKLRAGALETHILS